MAGIGTDIETPGSTPHVVVWAACALLAWGCEPVTLHVGRVRPVDGETRADAEPGSDAAVSDAGVSQPVDADAGPAEDGGLDAAAPTRKCVTLSDPTLAVLNPQSLPVVQLSTFACEPAELSQVGGKEYPPGSGVYGWDITVDADGGAFVDADGGELIMKRGLPYSLEWGGFLVTQLRVFGGREPCEAFPLFEEWADGGIPAALPAGACRDLTPAEDVRYVRIWGGDLIPGSSVKICVDPCP